MSAVRSGLTYDDPQRFPDDRLRRELIDGELFVTPAPGTRHQAVVLKLGARLRDYVEEHGGRVLVAPNDVLLSDRDSRGAGRVVRATRARRSGRASLCALRPPTSSRRCRPPRRGGWS
ncbi:MAG: Uma2 family endonuclease [Actinobacteria bacterium]|nr:Uma2 family endonuclease [Actinomycetota bacterium]